MFRSRRCPRGELKLKRPPSIAARPTPHDCRRMRRTPQPLRMPPCSRLGCSQSSRPIGSPTAEPRQATAPPARTRALRLHEGPPTALPCLQRRWRPPPEGLPRLPRALVQQRTLRHHQLDAIRRQHTLLHREALLVLPTLDLEDVALELVANVLAIHLSRQTLVVQRAPAKRRASRLRRLSLWLLRRPSRRGVRGGRAGARALSAQLLLIVDLDELLAASARIRNVELRWHEGGR